MLRKAPAVDPELKRMQTFFAAERQYGYCEQFFNSLLVRSRKQRILDSCRAEVNPATMDILTYMWRDDILQSKNAQTRKHGDAVAAAESSMFAAMRSGFETYDYTLPECFAAAGGNLRIVWPIQDDQKKW